MPIQNEGWNEWHAGRFLSRFWTHAYHSYVSHGWHLKHFIKPLDNVHCWQITLGIESNICRFTIHGMWPPACNMRNLFFFFSINCRLFDLSQNICKGNSSTTPPYAPVSSFAFSVSRKNPAHMTMVCRWCVERQERDKVFCVFISWCHLKGMSRYLNQNYK